MEAFREEVVPFWSRSGLARLRVRPLQCQFAYSLLVLQVAVLPVAEGS